MRFAIQAGFTAGDQFFNYLKDSFDVLYDEGRRGAPKMMSVGLHCRLVGRPGRAAALARFLDYVAGARAGLGLPPHRYRPALARAARAVTPAPAAVARPRAVRRDLRPRLRAFALDRRGGLGRRPAGRCRHGRGPAPRPLRRPGPGPGRAQAGPDPGPPRPRRQARPGRPPDRQIDQRAGLGRARPADRPGARDLHRAQRRLPGTLRLSLHHRRQGLEQGRDPGRVRAPPQQRPRHGAGDGTGAGRAHRPAPAEDLLP